MSERLRLRARCGLDECVEQADESVGQFAFPGFERRSEAGLLVEVENDGVMRGPDCEVGDDRFEPGHDADLLEQPVSLGPGDLYEGARYVDVHLIEPAPLYSGRAYNVA